QTLTAEERRALRGSRSMAEKDRISVVVCTNATGTAKVPLAIIGRARMPRVMRQQRRVPLMYFSQQSAWLTTRICQLWFDNVFRPFVKNRTTQPVALLWDNN